ncbi:MAG: histidine kinase [Saprospiraceae bacterium]
MSSNKAITIGLHLAFWIFIGLVHLLVFNWFIQAEILIWRALVNLLFLAFLFYFNAFILVNKLLEKGRYIAFGLAAVVMIIVFVPIRVWVNLLFPDIDVIERPGLDVERGFAVTTLLTNLSVVLFSTLYQALVNRYRKEHKVLSMLNEQNEAQLQFLKAQINPHFLFNTLNNIYSLAVVKSEQTAPMVMKLSKLLRYVVYDGKGEMVPVEREIHFIREFIELFQMRSEQPVNVTFHIDGDFNDLAIEPMVLIPIVENCFKHCDFDCNPNAFTNIEMKLSEGERLLFRTENSKNPNDHQKDKTGGVGLSNIIRRLDLKYPGKYLLSVQDNGSTFEVFFSMKLARLPAKSHAYETYSNIIGG